MRLHIWRLTAKSFSRRKIHWPIEHAYCKMTWAFWARAIDTVPLSWQYCTEKCPFRRIREWVDRRAYLADISLDGMDGMRGMCDPSYVPQKRVDHYYKRRAMWEQR
jgi:hypothetical protein